MTASNVFVAILMGSLFVWAVADWTPVLRALYAVAGEGSW